MPKCDGAAWSSETWKPPSSHITVVYANITPSVVEVVHFFLFVLIILSFWFLFKLGIRFFFKMFHSVQEPKKKCAGTIFEDFNIIHKFYRDSGEHEEFETIVCGVHFFRSVLRVHRSMSISIHEHFEISLSKTRD